MFARKKNTLDNIITSLQTGITLTTEGELDNKSSLKSSFALTDEGNIDKYLGIKIKERNDKKTYELSQPHLIKRIIEAVDGAADTNPTKTPMKPSVNITRDTNGKPRQAQWHYRSVIGMLNFVCNSTRPEVAFAVHQCARFAENPKKSHEKAVMEIIKYLKGSTDQGMIFTPDWDRGIQLYVDADFAGGWKKGDEEDPGSVLSRTGFVIMFAGCPIVWASRLQTEICLSTTEAEYVALSTAMRELIPFQNLLNELSLTDIMTYNNSTPKINCTIF